MEQIKPNYFGGANFEARTVKDIIEPARSISNKVSVRAALDQMQAQATDSSPVIDQCGELLGILSKNKMNRNVGGFGHDPKTEPVEAHIEKNNVCCFEDQTNCGGGANDAQRKGRRSSCRNARKIADRNDKY
jgi:signal-transduction protein with cAMP-binding, CBS, and nucleotidyltransferase domain